MLTEGTTPPVGKLRAAVKVMWVALAVVALFVAWIFVSRWQEAREVEQRAIERKRAEDKRTVELMGGDRFEILHFYAPAFISPGETAKLCYGVSNAEKVRIEPPAGNTWPSLNRCLDVRPARDTTYTLTIEDAGGNTKSASLTIQVK